MIIICPYSYFCDPETNGYQCDHIKPHEYKFGQGCSGVCGLSSSNESLKCEEIDHERYLRILEEKEEWDVWTGEKITSKIWSDATSKEAFKYTILHKFTSKPGGRKGSVIDVEL